MAGEDFKELVRQKTDIVSLVSRYVGLKKTGRSYIGLCPFHSERSPSFNVSPDRGTFYCFGCKESGDCFAFLQKIEGLSFYEALESLAHQAGLQMPERLSKDSVSPRSRLLAANAAAQELFVRLLRQNSAPREYIASRGISEETASFFGLGFAPDSPSLLSFELKRKGFTDEDLLSAGLLGRKQEGTHFTFFRNRLTFPVRNSRGEILSFSGRALADISPKYLNGPDSPIFRKGSAFLGIYEAKNSISADGAVLVEGNFDVLALHQAGLRGVVAPLGTAVTPEHLNILGRLSKNITVIFDGDAAGAQAALRTARMAAAAGFTVRVVSLPPGQDPASLARESPQDLLQRIARASHPSAFEFERLESQAIAASTMEPLLDVIAACNDLVVREGLIRRLISLTGRALGGFAGMYAEEDIRRQIRSRIVSRREPISTVAVSAGNRWHPVSREVRAEWLAVAALCEPTLRAEVAPRLQIGWLQAQGSRQLAAAAVSSCLTAQEAAQYLESREEQLRWEEALAELSQQPHPLKYVLDCVKVLEERAKRKAARDMLVTE